jgi:hypothetical protein
MTEDYRQEEQPAQEQPATPGESEPRPDQREPRGNPDREDIDVERGEGKLDRVSGN